MSIHLLARLSLRAGCASVLAATSLAASAAGASAPASADARYQQERARCLTGQSGQALETCLKEAGAAKQQAGQGQLTDADAQNARKRCEPLGADDKRDCLARANGSSPNTTSTGSVKGGGIVRETTTTIPTPVSPSASSAR